MTNNNLIPAHLTDEALRADLDSTARGLRRTAELLLPLPAEVRNLLKGEAHTMGNYRGGVPSHNLEQAINTWNRTGTFPYRDRAAAHREAEAKLNEGNLGPRLILPMN